jgi:hypothetical protein
VIPQCSQCGADLGPWENRRGCWKCHGSYGYSIADWASRLLEESDQPLPYWDIARLLRANGREVWEPSLKAILGTDRTFCWAGRGIYGLFRHGFLPGVRDLARVGGIYLHAADRRLTLAELDFVLKFAGYRYQELSLRNALWREVGLGLYRNESADSWSGSRDSASERTAARAMELPRGEFSRAIIDRVAHQVEIALGERRRRLAAR